MTETGTGTGLAVVSTETYRGRGRWMTGIIHARVCQLGDTGTQRTAMHVMTIGTGADGADAGDLTEGMTWVDAIGIGIAAGTMWHPAPALGVMETALIGVRDHHYLLNGTAAVRPAVPRQPRHSARPGSTRPTSDAVQSRILGEISPDLHYLPSEIEMKTGPTGTGSGEVAAIEVDGIAEMLLPLLLLRRHRSRVLLPPYRSQPPLREWAQPCLCDNRPLDRGATAYLPARAVSGSSSLFPLLFRNRHPRRPRSETETLHLRQLRPVPRHRRLLIRHLPPLLSLRLSHLYRLPAYPGPRGKRSLPQSHQISLPAVTLLPPPGRPSQRSMLALTLTRNP